MSVAHISIAVDDIQAVLALYDVIQVYRSTSGSGGTYTEITAASDLPATLLGTMSVPFTVNGTTLTISLSGADPVSIPFVGTDPTNILTAVSKINAAMPSLIASADPDDTTKLLLTNPLTGTGSSILVGGSAAAPLGLATTKVSGKAPRILMANLVTLYRFLDLDGDTTFWYKTRFYSSKTGATSAFANPQQGAPTQVLDDSSLVLATVNLTDITGAPIVGRRIIIVPTALQQIPNSGVNYGLLPGNNRIELTTDEKGHAETNLIIGSTIKVFFEGSGYSRACVVPAAISPATSIDLIAILSTQPDPFSIVQAPPMPIRS